MQITELHPPTNGGILYVGFAVSTRGRRYQWMAAPNELINSAFREEPTETLNGRTFWRQITAPQPLAIAVRKALRRKNMTQPATRRDGRLGAMNVSPKIRPAEKHQTDVYGLIAAHKKKRAATLKLSDKEYARAAGWPFDGGGRWRNPGRTIVTEEGEALQACFDAKPRNFQETADLLNYIVSSATGEILETVYTGFDLAKFARRMVAVAHRRQP